MHNQPYHLLFDHAKLLVHCLEVVSEEARPVEQLLEVSEGDLADCSRQAAIREIEDRIGQWLLLTST